MKNLQIRKAVEQDIDSILKLIDGQIKYHLSFNNKYEEDIPAEYCATGIMRFINSTDDLFLVAEKDRDLIGFFIAGIINIPFDIVPLSEMNVIYKILKSIINIKDRNLNYRLTGLIRECFIEEASRNAGIGSQFMNEAMNFFRERGVEEIKLIVYAGNKLGKSFWEKHGFSDSKTMMWKDM